MRVVAILVVALAGPAQAAQPDLSIYYGTERATLGAWFGTFTFGGVDAPQLPRPQAGVEVELVRIGHRIDGVTIQFPAETCDDLESALTKRWGSPNGTSLEYGVAWSSKSGAQGAKFEGNSGFDLPCRLLFFRRVSPQQWLNTSRKSVVPLWAIGKPAAQLEAAIAMLEPAHEDNTIRWEDTAIDGTHATLSAELRGTKIARVVVQTEDAGDKPAWHRLLAMFGKPSSSKVVEDTVSWRWHHAHGIEVSTFVGTLPPIAPVPGRPHQVRVVVPSEPGFPISISFGKI